MTTARAAMPLGRREQGLLSLLVVAAVLAPLCAPLWGADLWGWLPDHGHATAGVPAGAHHHPWDAAGGGTPGIAFTSGDLMGAPALPVSVIVPLVIPTLPGRAVARPVVIAHISPPPAPEPPPPR